MAEYVFSKFTKDLCKIRNMIAFGFTPGAIANLMDRPVEYVDEAIEYMNHDNNTRK